MVGHRPGRLPRDAAARAAIAARLAEVLGAILEATTAVSAGPASLAYAPGAPVLRALSSLAEGADRLFAREALELGYELVAVLPFARAEFERDFEGAEALAPDALGEFRSLLDAARAADRLTAFELDGEPSRRAEAYEAASEVVLNQSDILVAVWDGGEANGLGGTTATLERALGFNVPVVWIDARAPYGWRILRTLSELQAAGRDGAGLSKEESATALAAALRTLVAAELAPGGQASGEGQRLAAYQAERRPPLNLAFAWKLFRDLVDRGAPTLGPLRTRDFVAEVAGDWPIDGTMDATGVSAAVNRRLRPHYAWADKLADLYADAHRSAFIWSSLLAASAVLLALLPVALRWRPFSGAALAVGLIETAVLAAMVGLLLATRHRGWHRRWTEYRLLAELIRELRVLIPLGGGQPPPRTPAHLANYGDPARSWMFAHARAIARDLGLPAARVGAPYVADQIAFLRSFVGERPAPGVAASGQLGFHMRNCQRMERIHHHLHLASILLFGSTLVTVAADFALAWLRPPWATPSRDELILVSAFFPALGAALASINNQGEFARLQRRSRAMAQGLQEMRREIDALAADPNTRLAEVAVLARRTVTMMVEEAVDWRIVVLDLPHAAG